MTPVVTPLVLRDAIAGALWEYVKAQDLTEVCVFLGLKPPGEYEYPFSSKRSYVRARLLNKSTDELADLARKVVARSVRWSSQRCWSAWVRMASLAT